jgi:uncharacterized protein involved in cysteine biosynthesis
MIVLIVGVWVLLGWLKFVDWGWLDSAIDLLGGLGVVFVAWLLFPVAATAIVGFYLEDVADAVDPLSATAGARRQSVGEAIRSPFRSLCDRTQFVAAAVTRCCFFRPRTSAVFG